MKKITDKMRVNWLKKNFWNGSSKEQLLRIVRRDRKDITAAMKEKKK